MSFFQVRQIKSSRKSRRCYWCGEKIDVGQPQTTTAGLFDGDFYFTRFHPECYEALNRWRDEHPQEEYWPEEHSMKRGDHIDHHDL